MQSSYLTIFKVIFMNIKMKISPNRSQLCTDSKVTTELNNFFRSLRVRGVKLFVIYSGGFEGDIAERYFREVVGEEHQMLQDAGFLTSEKLRDADHLMTPLAIQETLLSLISKWVNDGYQSHTTGQ
jgi:hypothetical protein